MEVIVLEPIMIAWMELILVYLIGNILPHDGGSKGPSEGRKEHSLGTLSRINASPR